MLVVVASAIWAVPRAGPRRRSGDWRPVFSDSFDDSGALPPGCAAYDGASDGPRAPRRATSAPRRSPSPAAGCTSPCTGAPTAANRSSPASCAASAPPSSTGATSSGPACRSAPGSRRSPCCARSTSRPGSTPRNWRSSPSPARRRRWCATDPAPTPPCGRCRARSATGTTTPSSGRRRASGSSSTARNAPPTRTSRPSTRWFGFAVTTSESGTPSTSTALPAEFQVDFLRVYAFAPGVLAAGAGRGTVHCAQCAARHAGRAPVVAVARGGGDGDGRGCPVRPGRAQDPAAPPAAVRIARSARSRFSEQGVGAGRTAKDRRMRILVLGGTVFFGRRSPARPSPPAMTSPARPGARPATPSTVPGS